MDVFFTLLFEFLIFFFNPLPPAYVGDKWTFIKNI